jgi:hypothetical protein
MIDWMKILAPLGELHDSDAVLIASSAWGCYPASTDETTTWMRVIVKPDGGLLLVSQELEVQRMTDSNVQFNDRATTAYSIVGEVPAGEWVWADPALRVKS